MIRNEQGLVVPGPPGGDKEVGPWLSRYPLPSRPQIVRVTKEMAGDWLDFRTRPGTAHQRKVSKTTVQKYTEDMNGGRWRLTPQGLIADTDGWFYDGQHRLQALRNSNLDELDFWVFPDEPADQFAVVDTGYGRQARQLYTGQYAGIITSAARYLVAGQIGEYARRLSPVAVLDLSATWPELDSFAHDASQVANKAKVNGPAHLAVLAQAARTAHRDDIREWIQGLTWGFDLRPGDVRGHLRNRFMGCVPAQRPREGAAYGLIAKAWGLHVAGERMQILTWRENEGIPKIPGFKE